MRLLRSCLLDEPLPRLAAIADAWDISLEASNPRELADGLAARMLVEAAARQAFEGLTPAAQDALSALAAGHGRMPAAAFERRFGALRPMGPGRLERERPWLSPDNAAEVLWYRGFLFRGFDRAAPNPVETVFVPTDLLALLLEAGLWGLEPAPAAPVARAPAADAAVEETGAGAHTLDDLTSLLCAIQNTEVRLAADGSWPAAARAALRPMLRDADGADAAPPRHGNRFDWLTRLIGQAGWLKARQPALRLAPQPVMAWLQSPPRQQLAALYAAWRDDPDWNDLACADGIAFDMAHAWSNHPVPERQAVLRLLASWIAARAPDAAGVEDFAAWARAIEPDFARTDGRYDTWHIRDAATGGYLDGFEHWGRVEGGLIRFALAGPLSWLGVVQLEDGGRRARVTGFGQAMLAGAPAAGAPDPAPPGLRVGADGAIAAPAEARFARFQLSRTADWSGLDGGTYVYQVTPGSLARAREQGIQPARVAEFLQRQSANPVPPSLLRAIKQWGERGAEARLEAVALLRARDAAVLDALLSLPAIRAALIERLSPTSAALRKRDAAGAAAEALRGGWLIEVQ